MKKIIILVNIKENDNLLLFSVFIIKKYLCLIPLTVPLHPKKINNE